MWHKGECIVPVGVLCHFCHQTKTWLTKQKKHSYTTEHLLQQILGELWCDYFLFIRCPDQDCFGKNCLPSREVPTTAEQESYLRCFLHFFKHLPFFFHLSLFLFAVSRADNTWGHGVCADTILFLFCLRRSEKPQERKTKKWNCQTEQRHLPQTVDRLRVFFSFFCLLSFGGCPLSFALLSLSLWILACREVSVMAHHNMTLGNIDCSF